MKTIIYFSLFLICLSINNDVTSDNKNRYAIFNEVGKTDFNGLWINENEQTRGTTKCKIRYENNRFVVQMWGACTPEDCDWGEKISKEIDEGVEKFELLWEQGFAESTIVYEIVDGKLKMTNNRRYKDNSGRESLKRVEYFIKQ